MNIEDSPFGRIVVASNGPVFYTTRDFDGRLNENVARELTQFIGERFGIDAALTTCVQVHGTTVRVAPAPAAHAGKIAGATQKRHAWRECDSCDALWSAERGVALGIKVADCLPVAMLDEGNHIAANVHSGQL